MLIGLHLVWNGVQVLSTIVHQKFCHILWFLQVQNAFDLQHPAREAPHTFLVTAAPENEERMSTSQSINGNFWNWEGAHRQREKANDTLNSLSDAGFS